MRFSSALCTLMLVACSATSEGGGGPSATSAAGGAAGAAGTTGSSGSGAIGGQLVVPTAPDAGVSGIAAGAQCGGVTIDTSAEVITQPGNVLIVFDQSASMTTDFGGQQLWQAASSAVRDALTPYLNDLTVGTVFFPTTPGELFGACVTQSVAPIDTPPQIPFQPGPSFLNAWNARWTAANLVLSTPTDMAMTVAGDALSKAALVGQIVVILVTDGEPTCSMTPDSIAIATAWKNMGIPTYVIGLPGSGPGQAWLNQVAQAGGTGTFLTPADSQTLQAQLSTIMGSVVAHSLNSCKITFNSVPSNVTDIALVVTDGASGQQFRVEQGPDGWQLAADGSGAELLGRTCQDALAGRFKEVGFAFGCQDIPVLQ